ncbi:PAS domain S-box protein [Ktedonosporobacter rubrisoli]|uniref:histidine kinase n=1 Tax=Ktedonosporobacter rubrisoli TaxID=2509675 RepID=A0A4P6JUC1_KTERU|nr:PAS domain-containing protein [Ktedonosporobacter rubrisoli]QBD79238.1 PAS domain S-box protein [Ktedonosporobacter rubrisoli]
MPSDDTQHNYIQPESQPKQVRLVTAIGQSQLARGDESYYHTLFESLDQGIVCQDADGQIIQANAAAEYLLGMKLEAMRGRTLLDPLWRPLQENGSPFPADLHPTLSALRTGQPVSGTIIGMFNQQENAYRWFTVSSVPRFQANVERPHQVYTILHDFTTLHNQEQRMQQALEAILALAEIGAQTLLGQTPQMASAAQEQPDPQLQQKQAEQCCHLLGCQRLGLAALERPDELLRPLLTLGTSAAHARNLRNALQTLRLSNLFGDPQLVARLNAGESLALAKALPACGEQLSFQIIVPVAAAGQLSGILLLDYGSIQPHLSAQEQIAVQATARVAALLIEYEKAQHTISQQQLKLHAVQQELEHMQHIQQNVSSILEHEVQATLIGMQNYSELLCNHELSSPEIKELATDICLDSKHLSGLIGSVFELQHRQKEPLQLSLEWLDLNAVLAELVSHTRSLMPSCQFRLQLANALPIFRGDKDKLTTAMLGLLHNTARYTPQGGEVHISSTVEGNVIHVSMRNLSAVVSTEIADQAMLYPENAEPDLALIHGIIQMHGGKIWAESMTDQGLTFHFTVQFTNSY